MHVITGARDPAASFPVDSAVDDRGERRRANRAVAISALGLASTGLVELVIAVVSGSVALLGDALHNLSDVSTSVLVFVGFRASRELPSERYPYGYERAEDLAGIGVALVIWASAIVAGAAERTGTRGQDDQACSPPGVVSSTCIGVPVRRTPAHPVTRYSRRWAVSGSAFRLSGS
jgi:Cation efflux family